MRTRFFAILLAALLIAALPSASFAISGSELFIESAQLDGDTLTVLLDSGEALSADNITALLGGVEADVTSLDCYSSEQMGTSYLIVADVSRGLTTSMMRRMQTVINTIISNLRFNDEAAIATLGLKLNAGEFSRSGFTLGEQIGALAGTDERANLYGGIMDAIDLLLARKTANQRRCLIVLSDGRDDYAAGITADEVLHKLDKEHITLCTVAVLAKYPDDAALQAAKAFSGVARRLPCGLDATLSYTSETAEMEDAAKAILALSNTAYSLKLDVSSIAVDAAIESLYIKAGSLSDSIDVDTYALLTAAHTAKPTASPTAAPDASAEPTDSADPTQPAETSPSAALVEPAEITVSPSPEQSAAPATAQPQADTNSSDSAVTMLFGLAIPISPVVLLLICVAVLAAAWGVSRLVKKFRSGDRFVPPTVDYGDPSRSRTLYLTRLGRNGRFRYEVQLTDSVTIGRSARSSQLVLMDEYSVAPTHCRISIRDGQLVLIALDPKIATLLNGEAVNMNQHVRLKQNDVLTLGELNLKIRWE